MSRIARPVVGLVGLAVVALGAVGVVSPGAAVAASGVVSPGATATASPTRAVAAVPASAGAMPTVTIKVSKKTFTVTGPRRFQAGRISVALTATKRSGGGEFALGRLLHGYTAKRAVADQAAFYETVDPDTGKASAAGLKHLRRFNRDTTFYGGGDTSAGTTHSSTYVLPQGKVLLYDDSTDVPTHLTRLRVVGPAVQRSAPATVGTVKLANKDRFGGGKSFPHKGNLLVANTSTNDNHFLDLQRLTNGTTKAQLASYFGDPRNESSNATPSFVALGRNTSTGTDVLDPGQSQTLGYSLPRGEYLEVCFVPDAGNGRQHAFMGMYRIVHLT